MSIIRNRAYRRNIKQQKTEKRKKLILSRNYYYPFGGYIDMDTIDGKLQIVGTHIKYPQNSNQQKYYKRLSNRIVRRNNDIPAKGNGYRKCFDYWWTLY